MRLRINIRSFQRLPELLRLASALGLAGALAAARADTPLNDLIFTVGTTIADAGGQNYAYVLLGAQTPQLLAGKRFAISSKPGRIANAGSFTYRDTILQQTDPVAIGATLARSIVLNEDTVSLGGALDGMASLIPGITSLPLPQKLAAVLALAPANPGVALKLSLLARVHPALSLCGGQAYLEPINEPTTYEVREVNPATGLAGDVLGRVTVTPGAPVILPAPGAPFQVTTNAPSDHLRIRLRWGTPDELRRLALLNFGFDVWRLPAALGETYATTPPLTLELSNTNFVKVNHAPVMVNKDFSPNTGAGAADDPADSTTYFFSDSNGRARGTLVGPTNGLPADYLVPPFDECQQFYYFVTARDVLGRPGLVSPGGLATAYRRIPPSEPQEPRVRNSTEKVVQGSATHLLPRLQVSWQQNTNSDLVAEYWVYRWTNPSQVQTGGGPPEANRIQVVPALPNAVTTQCLDNGPAAPLSPGPTTYWYTVRAVSRPGCGGPGDLLLSPHSKPAWGVLRERAAPAATAGEVLGSCGTPVVKFQYANTLTNAGGLDPAHWNYRFTCQRREQGIAWVIFNATNELGGVETLGPLYFAPGNDTVSADYSLPTSGTNDLADVTCVAGTYYGQTSVAARYHLTATPLPGLCAEMVFLAGELLLTALSSSDPLLVNTNGAYCFPATSAQPYPDGTVGLRFGPDATGPLLIQVDRPGFLTGLSNAFTGSVWTDVAVATPDTNSRTYWISYPDCALGPLPQFRGCPMIFPAENCPQHITRAGDSGAVAPIFIRFALTPRTHEFRLYRQADGGPLTLLSQGAALYEPGRMVVRTDNVMPPGAAELCYFVQLLDENGNGSPLALIGCKEAKPAALPRPVLAEPKPAGSVAEPQVALNWFCSVAGVYRFGVYVARADQGGNQPTGLLGRPTRFQVLPPFRPDAPSPQAFQPAARHLGLSKDRLRWIKFDEVQLTPPIGANFGPGPQFTFSADLQPGVTYQISVAAMDREGNPGKLSPAKEFVWYAPTAPQVVPWPARPPVPVTQFDEDLDPTQTDPFQRVAAVVMRNHAGQLDQRYPVAIRIGVFQQPLPDTLVIGAPADFAATNPLVVANQLVCYQTVSAPSIGLAGGAAPPFADPHLLVFHRQSKEPTRNGQSLLPIVVYRQQIANNVFATVSTNLTQVTPLLERIPYSLTSATSQSRPSTIVTLYDKLLAEGQETITNANQGISQTNYLYLRDQQPVVGGAAYQYFVVRFNDQREISEIISAGSVTIPLTP